MHKTPLKIGIVGISGYSGRTALEILLKHGGVQVTYVSANNTQGKVSDIWPQMREKCDLTCARFDAAQAAACDLIFLAVPHTVSMQIAPQLLKNNVRIIDLSGDYRLKDSADYKKWYKTTHTDAANLGKAVYGLPELYREKIKTARLVANPGCYPTASLLALSPIAATHGKAMASVIVDAKSGISGAGKKAAQTLQRFVKEQNFKAYKVLKHQHTPEIDLHLSRISGKPVHANFVAHLLPVEHGILATAYVKLKTKLTLKAVHSIYKKFYKLEPFVRLLPAEEQPELKRVVGSNYCDIGLALNGKENILIVTAAIDNLVKGASGQAVQNMNIMYNFKEEEGLQP